MARAATSDDDRGVRSLEPRTALPRLPLSAFAFVMATGIVATATAPVGEHGWREPVGTGLLVLACLGYLVVVAATGTRAVRDPRGVARELRDPRTAFGAFTFVAASDVLGTWFALHGWPVVTLVLVVVAGLAWLVLGYALPALLLLGRAPEDGADVPLLRSADGTWFLTIVATQSLAVTLATVEVERPFGADLVTLVAVTLWGLGALGYIIVATVVLVRLLRYPVTPADLGAPYWIVSGATAITVLAGARILDLPDTPVLAAVRPTLLGLSVVLWGFGLGLVPLLVGIGHWRHVVARFPLRYETALWSIAFPLGMFAVASTELATAAGLGIIDTIGQAWTWLAVTAWLAFAVLGLRAAARWTAARR